MTNAATPSQVDTAYRWATAFKHSQPTERHVKALAAEMERLQAIVDCCDAECLLDDSMTVNERVAVMAEKLREATAIVDKLPKTADGVPIVPGCDVVWIDTKVIGFRCSSEIGIDGWVSFGDEYGCCRSRRVGECYSTREAAEAADIDRPKTNERH